MAFDLVKFQNENRVWPKLQLLFWGAIIYQVTQWAMSLPDISNGQAAIVSTVYLAGAGYGKIYGDTDPKCKPVVAVNHRSSSDEM